MLFTTNVYIYLGSYLVKIRVGGSHPDLDGLINSSYILTLQVRTQRSVMEESDDVDIGDPTDPLPGGCRCGPGRIVLCRTLHCYD